MAPRVNSKRCGVEEIVFSFCGLGFFVFLFFLSLLF